MLGAVAIFNVARPHSSPFVGAAAQRAFLRSVNQGVFMGTVAFGLHAIAFAKALRAMRRDMRGRRTKSLRTRSSKLWFLFVGLLWTTALANGICHIMMNSKARIHYDMSPHLSFDYFASHQTSTVNTVSIVSQILCLVLTDVFLLVRCCHCWMSKLGLASLCLSALITIVRSVSAPAIQTSGLWIMPFSTNWPVQVGLSGALHALFTLLLAIRTLGRRRNGGFLVLVVESALTYGVVSIVFAGLYCVGTLGANVLLPSMAQLQGIAVELIVVRIFTPEGHSSFPKPPLRLLRTRSYTKLAATSSWYSATHWRTSLGRLEVIYEDDEPALSDA